MLKAFERLQGHGLKAAYQAGLNGFGALSRPIATSLVVSNSSSKAQPKAAAAGGNGEEAETKRPPSALNLFVKANYAKVKEARPDLNSRQMMAELAKQYKDLKEPAKKPYVDEAGKLRAQYEVSKPPSAPKRPPTSYALFVKAKMPELQPLKVRENLSPNEMMGKIAELWRGLSLVEKQKYKDESDELKKKFKSVDAK